MDVPGVPEDRSGRRYFRSRGLPTRHDPLRFTMQNGQFRPPASLGASKEASNPSPSSTLLR